MLTLDQQLLIHIYANQKVFQTRMLEMICAIQETLETKKEPTGLLFYAVEQETVSLVNELVAKLVESNPLNSPFMREQIPDEAFMTWLKAVETELDNEEKGGQK